MVTWQTIRSSSFSRHSHDQPYAALVLAGDYEEAGDRGRFRVGPGDVLLHERFEAHVNRFSDTGAVVLNLPLPKAVPFQSALAMTADPDSIVRLAEKSLTLAACSLLSSVTPRRPVSFDWPDELASTMLKNSSLCLARWGRERGLEPWQVSRGFMQVFALTPSAFRARARARRAWQAISTTSEPLVSIAAELKFADQSHMTRSIRDFTGKAPLAWRYPCK